MVRGSPVGHPCSVSTAAVLSDPAVAAQVSTPSTGLNSHARELVSFGQADEVGGEIVPCRAAVPAQGALSSHGPPSQGGTTSCQEHASLTSHSFDLVGHCVDEPSF